MKILVCFKAVPNWEKILDEDWENFTPETDISYAGTSFNCFDESALETALRLKEQWTQNAETPDNTGVSSVNEISCVAVTVGKNPSASLVEALYAAGFDEVVAIEEQCAEFNPALVSARLAELAQNEGAGLVLTGVEAGMADTGLVPHLIAERLGIPMVSGVSDASEIIEKSRDFGAKTALFSVGNSPAVLRAVSLRARLAVKGKTARIIPISEREKGDFCGEKPVLSRPQCARECSFVEQKQANAVVKNALFEAKNGDKASKTAPKETFFDADVPSALRILQNTPSGKSDLAKLVLEHDFEFFSNAEILDFDENSVTVEKRVCAGNLLWTKKLSLPAAVTLPTAAEDSARIAIICGTGVGSRENTHLARLLAQKLGADFGLTRPAALCGWGEPDEIVGQSGRKIAPEIALILGASGAGAFIAGIEKTGQIIAVNNDPKALIFKNADVGVITDAPSFLRDLIDAVEGEEMPK